MARLKRAIVAIGSADSLSLCWRNLRRLVEKKRALGLEKPLIEWRFLRFRHNQHEEELARETARSLGVDLIEFFPGYAPPTAPDSEVQAADKPLQGPPIEGPAIMDCTSRPTGMLGQLLCDDPLTYGLPPAASEERKCDWHYFGTMIYPEGAVGPCCVSNDQEDDFASLDDAAGFTEAWNSPRFLGARLIRREHGIGDRLRPVPHARRADLSVRTEAAGHPADSAAMGAQNP